MTSIRTSAKAALLAGATLCAALALAPGAQATENGASVYLLGSGSPDSAVLPPVEGVFFANTVYYYSGEMGGGKELPLGGNIVAGIDATLVADFATVLWVPSTNFAGGTVALGLALPVGYTDVSVDAVLTGPGGGVISAGVSDDVFTVGDPLLTGSIGWKKGNTYFAASTPINIPIGDYQEGELANIAFHRWAVDASLAVSWHDPRSGWDVSAKAGLTFNGENDDTEYDSGDELHLEGSVSKALNPKWTLGAQAYYFDQQTGDSGPGARLGEFKGRETGVGAFAAYNFNIGHRPATVRLRAFHEFDVTNRPEGDSVWFDFSVPLVIHLPPGAGGQ